MAEYVSDWDGDAVRGLRRRLGLTQQELAGELGVRQQTVSEWEVGLYRPRGASVRMLRHVAERAATYQTAAPEPPLPASAPGERPAPERQQNATPGHREDAGGQGRRR